MWRLPLLLAALVLWAAPARAGAPMGCDGHETRICENGHLSTRCCPKGAKCNFRNPPFTPCGDDLCVEGLDIGRCPLPQAQTTEAKGPEECKSKYGAWEKACVGGKVKETCIQLPPTNYTGPSPNPSFQTCRVDRCTTSRFIEACHPARGEIADKACGGTWTKVCLGGKVAERCLPWSLKKSQFEAATYVACDDGSCAVGEDKNMCPR